MYMTFFCLISGVKGIAQGPKSSLVRVLGFFFCFFCTVILHTSWHVPSETKGNWTSGLQFDIKTLCLKKKYEITLGMMLKLLDSSGMGGDFQFLFFFFQNIA